MLASLRYLTILARYGSLIRHITTPFLTLIFQISFTSGSGAQCQIIRYFATRSRPKSERSFKPIQSSSKDKLRTVAFSSRASRSRSLKAAAC